MMMKSNKLIFFFLFMVWSNIHLAQLDQFEYTAEIKNAEVGWNSIELPLETFSKSANALDDIRLFQRHSKSGQFIELAYLMDIQTMTKYNEQIEAEIINSTKTGNTYAYTFELTNTKPLNHIQLDFNNNDFNWNVHLEGSMDLSNWETILEDYRIVSLNRIKDWFKLSNLNFPTSKFNYYKVSFQSDQTPDLNSITLSQETVKEAVYKEVSISKTTRIEDADQKTSIIDLDLTDVAPVAQLSINVNNESDYYRLFKIEGAVDSFETEKGWKYQYRTLHRGVISSIHDHTYTFSLEVVKQLKVTIFNDDNQALEIGGYSIKMPTYRLISKLDQKQDLYLAFGNKEAHRPKYDMAYFKDNIPDQLSTVKLGSINYQPKSVDKTTPLFANQWWLWGVMVVIILILGYFTLKMVRENT